MFNLNLPFKASKKRLKIAVLTRSPNNYSSSRLVEAARRRGHQVDCINTTKCYMSINDGHPYVHYNGETLAQYDAIIPRIGHSITFYGAAVVRQFEMMGTYTINNSIAITRSRDKLRSMQQLCRKNIDMPATGFAQTIDDVEHLLSFINKGHPPFIIKLLESTQGIGVLKADTKAAAKNMIGAFMSVGTSILIQEFIEEANGEDIRCFVLNGKVVGAMKRKAVEGDFRSNLHAGGTSVAVEISKEEELLAIAAAKHTGLGCAGVDIIRGKNGPMVLEVNSSPGLEGIEKATQIDIADKIIVSIEQGVQKAKKDAVV